MSYLEFLQQVMPETLVVLAALAVLGLDVIFHREEPVRIRFALGAAFALMGCVVAAGWLLLLPPHGNVAGIFVNDDLTRIVKLAILALTACTIVLSLGATFTGHVGEYLALVLMATAGMMFLVSATDLLMIFISLELTSLSLYILTAFNKRNIRSAEAALKYFLFGGMSAAFTLFGLSLVYGFAGTTNLHDIAEKLGSTGLSSDPLLLVALVMTAIGFAFKVAAAPFHLWAPDAYEGAPTPSAALIASGSKVASFFVFARLMLIAFKPAAGSAAWHDYGAGWLPVLAILAAASMLLGNLAALAQTNVKRLLAYSAVAHAGYALLGLLANNGSGVSSLVYYAITYGLTLVGAFGVVSVVEERTGGAKLSDFAGLGKREPFISFCMMIFMLSLAGIPPLAGFFGKFYLFASVISGTKQLGMVWLVIFAVAMSAVSLYYYLQVLKQIYVLPASDTRAAPPVSWPARAVLGVLALAVVLFGCLPNLLVEPLVTAIKSLGF